MATEIRTTLDVFRERFGEEPSRGAVTMLSAHDLQSFDEMLGRHYANPIVREPTADEFRAAVPMGHDGSDLAFRSALTFAPTVAVNDPVDELFFDDTTVAIMTGWLAASDWRWPDPVDPALLESFESIRAAAYAVTPMDASGMAFRHELASRFEMLLRLEDAIAEGVIVLSSARGQRPELLDILGSTQADDSYLLECLDAWRAEDWVSNPYAVWRASMNDIVPASLRWLTAVVGRGRLVATTEAEWRFTSALLRRRTETTSDRDRTDARVVGALAATQLPVRVSLDARRILDLRAESDAWSDWQNLLRQAVRAVEEELPLGDPRFEEKAGNVLAEVLLPASHAVSRAAKRYSAKGVGQEAATISLTGAGLGAAAAAGLAVSPAAIVALPVACL